MPNKPKPTKLRVVQGNPGKQRVNDSEPEPDAFQGFPPTYLDDVAREKWLVLAPLLQKLGLLGDIDEDLLAAYCTAFSRWREAEEFIKTNGTTYITRSRRGEELHKRYPQVAIASDNLKRLQSLGAEFGLSPSSRTRLDFAGREGMDDAAFLFGSR